MEAYRVIGSSAPTYNPRGSSVRTDPKLRDEVAELACTFNSMVEEVSLTEERRRNLVADVVQQLRTRGNKIGATFDEYKRI